MLESRWPKGRSTVIHFGRAYRQQLQAEIADSNHHTLRGRLIDDRSDQDGSAILLTLFDQAPLTTSTSGHRGVPLFEIRSCPLPGPSSSISYRHRDNLQPMDVRRISQRVQSGVYLGGVVGDEGGES